MDILIVGKGILAADESTQTIGKRFLSIGIENNEENRRAYRGMLFSTPNLRAYISGVILSEETLSQCDDNGQSFVTMLSRNGMIPGIKVDKGLRPLPGAEAIECTSTGLDGLEERASCYYAQGARFAKWRSVLQITTTCPTSLAIHENAWTLARYARSVQEAGLVPIVEPEILMVGSHSIERTAQVQEEFLCSVYRALQENNVYLKGSLLKPSMTCPGEELVTAATPEQIARSTLQTLSRTVPAIVPGVFFLSGGLTEEVASNYLNAINSKQLPAVPWTLSFSFGRALQQSCLKTWQGRRENIPAAQQALLARAKANSAASLGQYVAGSQPFL